MMVDKKRSNKHREEYVHEKFIGDFFSYHFDKDRRDLLCLKMIEKTHKFIHNDTLINVLFSCHDIQCFDVKVYVHTCFDIKLMKSDCHMLCKKHTTLNALSIFRLMINKRKHSSKKTIYQTMIYRLCDHMLIIAKRVLLHDIASRDPRNLLLVIDTFDYRYLYQLSENIMGFVITKGNISSFDQKIADAFDIQLIKTRHAYENHYMAHIKLTQTKVYASLVDTRHIDVLRHMYGGVLFHSEYMLVVEGLMMDTNDIYSMYETLFKAMKGKPIYITIPTFTDTLCLAIDTSFRTEVNRFCILHNGLKNWVEGLSKAIRVYHPQVTFIIPHLNSGHDLEFWREEIDVLYAYVGDMHHVGMMMETEAALQYCEDFKAMKPVIFKLDDLMREYDVEQQTKITHHKWLIDDLRAAHYIYRIKQPKQHMLYGHPLEDPDILCKCINMGFREFVIPKRAIKRSLEVLYAWESSRGKYVKKANHIG